MLSLDESPQIRATPVVKWQQRESKISLASFLSPSCFLSHASFHYFPPSVLVHRRNGNEMRMKQSSEHPKEARDEENPNKS